MFADEGSNVVTSSVEILSQSFLDILKELLSQLTDTLISNPIKNHQELRQELKKAKQMEKRAELLERENNCGYRDNEGSLISIDQMLKNKNELSSIELDYSFDNNLNVQKLEIIYEVDTEGNKVIKLDGNGKPMLHKTTLTEVEKLKAETYLNDLKKLASDRGLLCAISETGVDLDGNGLFHSSLVFRTKDSTKLNNVISSLQIITALRSSLFEAGVEDAFSMSFPEVMDLVELNKAPYDVDLAIKRIKEQYKEEVAQESPFLNTKENIEQKELPTLVESSNIEAMKEVIVEKYGSLEKFYQSNPTRMEISQMIKDSLSREFQQDAKKHFFHLYSDKENKLMFTDKNGGFHFVNLKNLEQDHFKDCKNFIKFMIKESEKFELSNIKKINFERMEAFLETMSTEEISELIGNFFGEMNKEYEEKTKLTDLKYRNSPLYEDEISMKALVEFEIDGNDSILLKDSRHYLDVDMAVNMPLLVDKEKLLDPDITLHSKYAIKNILELQSKYDFNIPDNVKEIIYKSGKDLPLSAMNYFYEMADQDPRILRDPTECKNILKEGAERNKENIVKAFGIEDKADQTTLYTEIALANAEVSKEKGDITNELKELHENIEQLGNFDEVFLQNYQTSGFNIDDKKYAVLSESLTDKNITYIVSENKDIGMEIVIEQNYKDIKGSDFNNIYESLEVSHKEGEYLYKVLNQEKPGVNVVVNQDGMMKVQIQNTKSQEKILGRNFFMEKESTESSLKKCEEIFKKYEDGKTKINRADMDTLRKNLKTIKNDAPNLYKKINGNPKIVKGIKELKEKGK